MVLIIKYLEGKSESSIRGISKKLEISERKVRYDIDNINDALTLNQLKPILKEGKGRLVIPADLAKLALEEKETYILLRRKESTFYSICYFLMLKR